MGNTSMYFSYFDKEHTAFFTAGSDTLNPFNLIKSPTSNF